MAEEERSITNTSTDITIAVIIFLVVLVLLGVYIDRVIDWILALLAWILSRNWGAFYIFLVILFLTLNLILVGFIIMVMRKYAKLDETLPLERPLVVNVVPLEETVSINWEEIRGLANSPNPSDWSMAVIRADGLLNDILHNLGYEGETMADRLKIVDPTKLRSLDRIWSAHRLRNEIVHGPPQDYTREAVIQALRSYEQAFRELEILKEKKV